MHTDIEIRAPHFVRLLFKEFDDSSASVQAEKLLFFFFSVFMMCGALVWGVLCLIYGYRMPSLIPFGYIILTLFNFLFFGSLKDLTRIGYNIQIAMSLILPFVFQYLLGGVASSGVVMLWSLLALLGSLVVERLSTRMLWLGLFIGLSLGTFYLESLRPEEVMYSVPVLLNGINIMLVSLMIYALGNYFATTQNTLRKILKGQKKEMSLAKEEYDVQLGRASNFLSALLNNKTLESNGYRQFQVQRQKGGISSNFTWSGEYGNKKVTVIIDNPSTGIRGTLESMFLWNLIDTGVYQLRKKTPKELIEYLQEEVYGRYDSDEFESGMKNIGVVVLYNDILTNQLFYAAVHTHLLVGTRSERRVICGFKSDYSDTVLADNGTKMVKGHMLLEPGTRTVVVNDSLLRALDIHSDEHLMDSEGGLGYLLEHDFSIAKKKLRIQCDKLQALNDIFLQCIEF
ncbi:MAG: hypothetical protein HKN79_12695 [Flavobacteriales bacterium]|nr:hypothetical protein [Flavobacteriales bacterium]